MPFLFVCLFKLKNKMYIIYVIYFEYASYFKNIYGNISDIFFKFIIVL